MTHVYLPFTGMEISWLRQDLTLVSSKYSSTEPSALSDRKEFVRPSVEEHDAAEQVCMSYVIMYVAVECRGRCGV